MYSAKSAQEQVSEGYDRTAVAYAGAPERLVKTGGRLVKQARYYWLLLKT